MANTSEDLVLILFLRWRAPTAPYFQQGNLGCAIAKLPIFLIHVTEPVTLILSYARPNSIFLDNIQDSDYRELSR